MQEPLLAALLEIAKAELIDCAGRAVVDGDDSPSPEVHDLYAAEKRQERSAARRSGRGHHAEGLDTFNLRWSEEEAEA
jgi:hypothetical protein